MIDGELMQEIQEAAAQGKTSLHEENVCGTCYGYFKSLEGVSKNGGLVWVNCPNCNGTGKENAK